MKLSFIARVLLPLALIWMSGCAVNQATATRISDMDLRAIKSVYVVEHADDKYKVAGLIKENLAKRGYQVAVGPEMKPPYPADAAVTYIDKWMWDMSTYMIELSVSFRNATTDFPALSGNSLHTSLTRKSPEAMVQEVLDNIFKTK